MSASAVLIGAGLVLAQPAIGQGGAAVTIGSIPVNDGRFRSRFETLLLAPRGADLAAGWHLARTLGPAASALLWDLHAAEKSNERRRIIVLLAAMLSGGPDGDAAVVAALDRGAPADRLLACLGWALGPRRDRPRPSFWGDVLGRRQSPLPLWQVAALLASARFPQAAAGIPTPREDDPGIVAAAVLAGVTVPDSLLGSYFRPGEGPRHAELVWRAVLLSGLLEPERPIDIDLLQRARWIESQPGELLRPARLAAVAVRARAGDLNANELRPPWQLLQAMIVDARSATLLADWLHARPQPLDEDPRRLAVAYALSRPIATVVEQRGEWGAAASVRQHIALALAWRLLGEAAPAPIEWSLYGLPEWFFVRWASGAKAVKDVTLADPILEQASLLAQDERIDRAALREVLEQAMWRLGSHPGLTLQEAHHALVRDLLLTGSNQGFKYAPVRRLHDAYLPSGLGRGDPFFDIAVQAYDYLSRPALPIPRECRLR